jgi:hypothetical protein
MKMFRLLIIHYFYLFRTANWFLPGGSGSTIRQHTNTLISENIAPRKRDANKTTQTAKDILSTMNTKQKKRKNRVIAVTGLGGF